jgi:hypothetical protein
LCAPRFSALLVISIISTLSHVHPALFLHFLDSLTSKVACIILYFFSCLLPHSLCPPIPQHYPMYNVCSLYFSVLLVHFFI